MTTHTTQTTTVLVATDLSPDHSGAYLFLEATLIDHGPNWADTDAENRIEVETQEITEIHGPGGSILNRNAAPAVTDWIDTPPTDLAAHVTAQWVEFADLDASWTIEV